MRERRPRGGACARTAISCPQRQLERDFETVFSTLNQRRAGALLIATDPFLNSRSEQLVALAARHGLPAMHTRPERPFSGAIRTLRRHRRMTESDRCCRLLRADGMSQTFSTASTQTGTSAQPGAAPSGHRTARPTSIQNDSGLHHGPAGTPVAG
jgi:hypothetical protein